MTIMWAGGEMGAFVPSDSTVNESAVAGTYNSSFARCSLFMDKSTAYAETPDIGAGCTDAWAHFDLIVRANSPSATRFIWYDDADVARVRLAVSTTSITLQYDVGAGFVTAGSAASVDMLSLQTIDLHVDCNNASGTLKLYIAGTLRIDGGTINTTAIDQLNKFRIFGSTSATIGFYTRASQAIIAHAESTIGMRLMTAPATGTGATDQMTGAYTAIDEVSYSDSDFIWSDTPAQVELFSCTPTGSLTGYTVRGVTVTARANTDGTGPTKIQMAVRTGGTTYFSGDLVLDAGFGAFHYTWETNPNTTLPWTAAEAAAIQFGVKSIA